MKHILSKFIKFKNINVKYKIQKTVYKFIHSLKYNVAKYSLKYDIDEHRNCYNFYIFESLNLLVEIEITL